MAKAISLEERLWAKVDRSGGPDACWIWLGPVNRSGYGQIQRNGKNIGVHRAAYELAHGEIPEGVDVCHNCPGGDNPRCCNERHLWLGTHQDNMRDMERKGRARHRNGEAVNFAKLTAADVVIVRELAAKGVTLRALAKEYGVSPTAISLIVSRKNWKHVA
jgi:hypothetical protein